jgi:magnesium transporter
MLDCDWSSDVCSSDLPTVVFSLYGMNFDYMPELKWPWAYPALLALTGAGMALLYRRLKKRGWI